MIRFTCFLFLCLSFATSSIHAYTPCESKIECAMRASPEQLSNVTLRLYPSDNTNEYTAVLIENAINLLEHINFTKQTVLYISGWREGPNTLSTETVLSAYTKRHEENILLVNYEHIAGKIYPYVVASLDGVGYFVANALDQLIAGGLNSSTLRVVGHSLGGQMAGIIGRYMSNHLPRITALDPAGPLFEFNEKHLSANDAEFVDVIHTDAGYYGSRTSKGTVDFYPNGGTRFQPGCPKFLLLDSNDVFCDHQRSWYFYAESIGNEAAFLGLNCNSYHEFKNNTCGSDAKIVIMGYSTPTNASGKFYLQTNSASPFGRGQNGVIYVEE